MRRMRCIIIVCVALSLLAGCGRKQNKIVEDNAQKVAEAFNETDMDAINETIFGPDEVKAVGQNSVTQSETEKSREGVLESIFRHVTIEVKKTTDRTIEYEITAPDMRDVFAGLDFDKTNMSSDELLQMIKDYAQNAEKRVETVSLSYSLYDGKPIVNYKEEAFINAITGGFLDAYKSLYAEMISEYEEGDQE